MEQDNVHHVHQAVNAQLALVTQVLEFALNALQIQDVLILNFQNAILILKQEQQRVCVLLV